MKTIDLEGLWKVQSPDGVYSFETSMPGSLFQALEAQGEFGEKGLFYRENNRMCERIADRDFRFSRTFTLSPDFFSPGDLVLLEADGLDTLARISLNGKPVGESANMHRRYRFEIGPLLRPGENRIEILFANTLEYVRREHERRKLWHAYWDTPEIAYPGFNMIRKSHCSYGWDWGPIVPDVGIWRGIRISAYRGGRIEDMHVRQEHDAGKVTLTVSPDVRVLDGAECICRVTVNGPAGGRAGAAQVAEGRPGETMRIEIRNPELWWPNGLGAQPLYEVRCELIRTGDGSAPAETVHEYSLSVGLRTMTVRREPDQWGESFAFEVNGVPVFARGGDWIPEDVFLTRPDHAFTERLIRDAARANFNCLRVWGGGIYPSDTFFELCDRYGLVVWQDLMFACAIYDVNNPAFLENITEEVRDNLRRIRHHASLGLVCGNNEMEWGFVEWGFPHTAENRTEYLKQYQFIFPAVAREVCPEVFYWPASPSSGGDFEAPNSPDRGDCHFWDVWHKNVDFSEYKKHFFRFMSEFGFESFPSMKTVHAYTAPEDLNAFSPVMEDHQRCVGGNGKIMNYIARYFRYPKDLTALVYVSQVSQAEAQRAGIEHWRRNRGRCMGAVYWQYNDNWPVASWSSVDYYGRWKALHYVAKRTYHNVLVSCDGDRTKASLHLSNEGREPVSGTIVWKLVSTSGETVRGDECEAKAQPFSSVPVAELDLAAETEGTAARERLLFFTFTATDGRKFSGYHAFVPFKQLSLVDPGITWQVAESNGILSITLRSPRPALFVEIDFRTQDRVLSDNFFSLPGGNEGVTVTFEAEGMSADEVQHELIVRSLTDSY